MWEWIKKYWKILLGALAGIATLLVAATAVRAVRDRVQQNRKFKVVPGDSSVIDIEDEGEFVRVKLPRNVASYQVAAAGISSIGEWSVETLHTPVDRHGDSSLGRGDEPRI